MGWLDVQVLQIWMDVSIPTAGGPTIPHATI